MLEWGSEVPYVSWLSHARLVRALMNSTAAGSLSGNAFEGALDAAVSPPGGVLRVLDPRPYTAEAAQLMGAHTIPLLPANMLAAAIHHRAAVHVYSKNFVDKWEGVIAGSGASIRVYTAAEIRAAVQ